MLRRSILANLLGVAWLAVLSLVLTPLQIRILGVEAYGLLAFIAALQALLNVFDLGCSVTIAREVASDASPDRRRSREVVEGLAGWYWSIGLLLGAALFLGSAWLARDWLGLDGPRAAVATLAIRLAAVAVAARWPVSFYAGVITGRQRFGLFNLLTGGAATLGLLGGGIVIIASGRLTAFLLWRAITALVEVSAYVGVSRRLLPGLRLWPGFSLLAVTAVWRFALGTHVMIVTWLVLMQADRFMVSKFAPMSALGYYSLAYTAAFLVTLLQSTVSSAVFPAFAADARAGRLGDLGERCAKATQLVSYMVTPAGFLLIFFGGDLLRLWVDSAAATASYPALRLLALGFTLGAVPALLSTLAVAAGHPRIPRRVYAVGLALYLPTLYLLTRRYSGTGAALGWVLLQCYAIATIVPSALRLLGERRAPSWLGRHMLPFLAIGAMTFGLVRLSFGGASGGILRLVIAGGLSGTVYLAAGFLWLHRDLRADFRRRLARGYLMVRHAVRLQRAQ